MTNTATSPRANWLIALLAAFTLIAVGCGGSSDSDTAAAGTDAETTSDETDADADTSPEVESDTDAIDTSAGWEAAQWSDTVTVTAGDGSYQFESNGIPDHELPDQFLVPQAGSFTPPVTEDEVNPVDTDVAVVESNVDQTITVNPVYSETTTDTNLGTIGIAISGAQLFNDYEDQDRSFVALDDNFSIDGVAFVDSCNGHPLALAQDGTGTGNYHYHGIPYCITDAVDSEGQHSAIIGFLLDGFPFYGPLDTDGATITAADLDECNGHEGPTPEFPEGIYHYHLKADASPYTPDCYHGITSTTSDEGGEGGGPGEDAGGPGEGAGGPGEGGGGPPDLSEAADTLGVSEDDLLAALGQPPFDFDAAAATLGVDAADLETALPAPPDGGGPGADGGAPPQDGEGGPGEDGPDEGGGEAAANVADIDADDLAVRSDVALGAQWADNVSISIDGNLMTFESDGLPSHEYLDSYLADGRDGKYIAGGVESYNARFSIPVVPTLADDPIETGNGAIGVAISGAVFFDPYEGDGSDTIANDDNSEIDGIPFIDACGGHPLPNASQYHYHGIPFCITDAVDTAGQHSTLIGYLVDGHAIYGPQDTDGNEPTDLDTCLGHTGETPEFEDDTYHYHVTSTANYISECLAGLS